MKLKSINEVTREYQDGMMAVELTNAGESDETIFKKHQEFFGEYIQKDRQHLIQTMRKEVEGKLAITAAKETVVFWKDLDTLLTTLEKENST